ncbi:Gfo/Idh/MocA family oxidoreductase [Priestia megaterium]|jgi:myo-inositol 2-dehydrogenase/D-chiro-inositol 1-dehydrogenase|uniref:Gfo/Idh/MocA family oxidoreductase n=1 Tax=Priestia megaterium TaxID=1404 RepID=UPI000BECC423|nr:Gfo/Idh/MocA family oxidoreductase [Priestia megaterium]MDH6656870.1 myo-inositol 2-dehydrogenase/D-chiro-inositol 1-dehydrogenase [Bacillus sp. PvP124]MBV6737949.1 Gfo/Idh/MocA family oxidoreductase [Priestia megaterium]MED3861008.1 Gfo/Idh/MocA family oxidoreductase [Priestia megaterium]MED4068105.1 Gfo/Idh/MocA family oxidoreductase [Priestia megaterium]PEA36858.1 dehydrogenase [Priestia megaterium]
MKEIRIGLVGAGRMGSFHGRTIARKIHGAKLNAIADPVSGAAERLAKELGVSKAYTDPKEMFQDPHIDAVVIAAPARSHADLIVAAANAGKAVFCEKPMAITLEEADKAILAAQNANVPLQVGFNRRFASDFRAAHNDIVEGRIGTPQLLRSLTRDPGLGDPTPIPEWTIFLETLIHDFDTLLYLNPGAEPIEVYAVADALVRPDFKDKGLLDTAVVNIRFDNGAIATAEANFQAVYGYDVRGEVFGSAGMVMAGGVQQTNMIRYTSEGISRDTYRRDTELLHDAYVAELTSFVECVRNDSTPYVTGNDARRALSIALACITSVKTNTPVKIKESVQLI